MEPVGELARYAARRGKKIGKEAWGNGRDAANYLTKAQVARKLGISVRSVNNYMKTRDLPYLKPAGRVLFVERAVEVWVQTQRMIA